MFACFDVGYTDADSQSTRARSACVAFNDWADHTPSREVVVDIETVAPYVPGEFYRRELPCILAALDQLSPRPTQLIVDGYVWLDANRRRGLGAYLFEALGGEVLVIGVAKTPFQDATNAAEVLRGKSTRPLYVTAEGVPEGDAADAIRNMHGEHRVPTLLRRVDQLSRSSASGCSSASG